MQGAHICLIKSITHQLTFKNLTSCLTGTSPCSSSSGSLLLPPTGINFQQKNSRTWSSSSTKYHIEPRNLGCPNLAKLSLQENAGPLTFVSTNQQRNYPWKNATVNRRPALKNDLASTPCRPSLLKSSLQKTWPRTLFSLLRGRQYARKRLHWDITTKHRNTLHFSPTYPRTTTAHRNTLLLIIQ